MTAFPGTPAIQNAIPMPYFNTTPFAAPVFGTLAGLGMLVFGTLWLNRRRARAAAAGEGYGSHAATDADAQEERASRPSMWLAMVPVIAVIALNALFTYLVIPWMDTSYLAQEDYGSAEISAASVNRLRGN